MSDASARFEDWFPPDLDVLEREGRDLLLEDLRTRRAELEAEVGGPYTVAVDADTVVLVAGARRFRVERTPTGRLLVTRPPDPRGRL